MTHKYAEIIPLYVMYIGISFKFFQTHGTSHHWTSQIPWQYLGRTIHLIYPDLHNYIIFYHKILGGKKMWPPLSTIWGHVPHPLNLVLASCSN